MVEELLLLELRVVVQDREGQARLEDVQGLLPLVLHQRVEREKVPVLALLFIRG